MQAIPRAGEAAPIRTRTIRVESLGVIFPGFLATPSAVPWRSAAVVVPDRDGLDENVVTVCRDLASAGHAALAIDLPVAELCGPPGVATAALDRFTDTVRAGLAVLRAVPATPPNRRFGVVGYGLGGLVALVAGYRCHAGAAVSFYGEGPMRLRTDLARIIDEPKPHAANVLCLIGADDDDLRPADLGALREHLDAFRVRHEIVVYPRARRGFCRPDDDAYRPRDAADAWARLLHALDSAPRARHRFSPKRPPPAV